MSKVLVDRELLEQTVKHLEWDGDGSQTVMQYAQQGDRLAEELAEAIAQPAEAGRPGDILSFPGSAHSMETGTEEPKPSQVSPAAPGAPTMEYPIKTPEERPVRHDGGKYGYTCSSLTTQIFRFGGCSWPIHRSRRPEPNRAAALG